MTQSVLFLLCGFMFTVFPSKKADQDKPLFLTPFIERKDIEDARNEAEVNPFLGDIQSYSGFLTVNKTYNSNLFFWYIVSEIQESPIVVWLNGWTTSALRGAFLQNGPYEVSAEDCEMMVTTRPYSWHKSYNMLYIDSVVGTGFSFTDNPSGLKTDQEGIGDELYIALLQFFDIFPELLKLDLYVGGLSYAGKYAPALAITIHKRQIFLDTPLNFRGLFVGNPWSDPVSQIGFDKYLFQLGLIGSEDRDNFCKEQAKVVDLINEEEFSLATRLLGKLILFPNSLFFNLTGLDHYYSYGDSRIPSDSWLDFVVTPLARKRFHVGNLTFWNGTQAAEALFSDITKSVKPWIETLSEYYCVMLYSGQVDILCGYPMMLDMIDSLNWSGSKEMKAAERKIWKVENVVAGYTRTYRTFTEALVRNAGHTAAIDKPLEVLTLVKKFISRNV